MQAQEIQRLLHTINNGSLLDWETAYSQHQNIDDPMLEKIYRHDPFLFLTCSTTLTECVGSADFIAQRLGREPSIDDTTYSEKILQLSDIGNNELKQIFARNSSSLAFSPDGKTLAYLGQDIQLWNLDHETLEITISIQDVEDTLHQKRLWRGSTELAFCPDGQTLAIFHAGQAILWDIVAHKPQMCFSLPLEYLRHSAFSADGQTLAICSNEGTQIWDLNRGELQSTTVGHSVRVGSRGYSMYQQALALSPNGKTLVSTASVRTGDGSAIRFWGASDGKLQVSINAEGEDTHGSMGVLTFSPTGHIVALGSDRLLSFRDAHTTEWRTSYSGHLDEITSIAFSSDGKLLISVDKKGTVKLWNVKVTENLLLHMLHEPNWPTEEYCFDWLDHLLETQQWRQADQYTAFIMQEFTENLIEKDFFPENIEDLRPVFREIDRLWMHHSNNHYGFSAQKRIWGRVQRQEGQRIQVNDRDRKPVDEFQFRLGWLRIGSKGEAYDGDNDETIEDDYRYGYAGYYPRRGCLHYYSEPRWKRGQKGSGKRYSRDYPPAMKLLFERILDEQEA